MFLALLEAADTVATTTGTGTGTGMTASQPGGLIGMIFGNPFSFIIVLGLVLYFLIYRPNQKKQKEREAMLNSIKKNDKVMTIGGIIGSVAAVKKDVITIRVNEKTRIDFRISAIDKVLTGESIPEGGADDTSLEDQSEK